MAMSASPLRRAANCSSRNPASIHTKSTRIRRAISFHRSTLKDPAHPEQQTKVTVFGVKFDSWTYNIPSDAFVMEAITFQAMRVAYEES